MNNSEIDDRAVGIVTVGIGGAWQRIKFALHILFLGEATFGIMPENFTEEGGRLDDTTCILTAPPDKRPKWCGGKWNEGGDLWMAGEND